MIQCLYLIIITITYILTSEQFDIISWPLFAYFRSVQTEQFSHQFKVRNCPSFAWIWTLVILILSLIPLMHDQGSLIWLFRQLYLTSNAVVQFLPIPRKINVYITSVGLNLRRCCTYIKSHWFYLVCGRWYGLPLLDDS